tara:strand:- start:202 stop:486 length:285 start_codon:yes stop_codon:yes gene_type:complete
MAGSTNGSTMGRKNAPFVYRKRGVFYLQKHIPKELIGHYGRTFIRKSLRTKDRLEASKLASQPVIVLSLLSANDLAIGLSGRGNAPRQLAKYCL